MRPVGFQPLTYRRFTLLEVECLGACSNAPMVRWAVLEHNADRAQVQINDEFYVRRRSCSSQLMLCRRI